MWLPVVRVSAQPVRMGGHHPATHLEEPTVAREPSTTTSEAASARQPDADAPVAQTDAPGNHCAHLAGWVTPQLDKDGAPTGWGTCSHCEQTVRAGDWDGHATAVAP